MGEVEGRLESWGPGPGFGERMGLLLILGDGGGRKQMRQSALCFMWGVVCWVGRDAWEPCFSLLDLVAANPWVTVESFTH